MTRLEDIEDRLKNKTGRIIGLDIWYDDQIKWMIKEIKKLEKEIETWCMRKPTNPYWTGEIDGLKKENKKLREELQILKSRATENISLREFGKALEDK